MWSYKVLTRFGGIGSGIWGMVTNTDPLPTLDLEHAPIKTIERPSGPIPAWPSVWMKIFGTG